MILMTISMIHANLDKQKVQTGFLSANDQIVKALAVVITIYIEYFHSNAWWINLNE